MSKYIVLFDGNDGPSIMVKGLGQYVQQSYHNQVVDGANVDFVKKNLKIEQLKARVEALKESLSSTSNALHNASLLISAYDEDLGDDYSTQACAAWGVLRGLNDE